MKGLTSDPDLTVRRRTLEKLGPGYLCNKARYCGLLKGLFTQKLGQAGLGQSNYNIVFGSLDLLPVEVVVATWTCLHTTTVEPLRCYSYVVIIVSDFTV